jgi:hypothetical protein
VPYILNTYRLKGGLVRSLIVNKSAILKIRRKKGGISEDEEEAKNNTNSSFNYFNNSSSHVRY